MLSFVPALQRKCSTWGVTVAWPIFISMIAVRLYTITNTFVLGLVAGNVAVGLFSSAERIIRIITELYRPIFQALYPHISAIAAESRTKAIAYLKKLLKPVAAISVVLFLVFLSLADFIIRLVLGDAFGEAVHLFRILTPLIVLVPLGAIAANLTAIPFRLDRYFSGIYVAGAIVNFILLLIVFGMFHLGAVGSAVAMLCVEALVTTSFFLVLRKQKIFLW